jgi:hypothetical protein
VCVCVNVSVCVDVCVNLGVQPAHIARRPPGPLDISFQIVPTREATHSQHIGNTLATHKHH